MNEPHDHEFEDFLRRRRPLFRRGEDDVLEPPAELDRVVLRQAREAIQAEPPQRLYRAPRWGAGLAIAATLVVGLTFVFKAGMPPAEVRPQVTIENIAQRVEPLTPATAERSAPALTAPAPTADAPLVVDLGPRAVTPADAPLAAEAAPPPGARSAVSTARDTLAAAPGTVSPAWRQDSRAWLEEIERLRAAGNVAQADAELAEYNRQHRALAVSPDR
jgi:hypothetical protein